MLSGVIVTDEIGEILVERYYTKTLSRQDVDPICKLIRAQQKISPIISQFGLVFASYYIKKMYFIGIAYEGTSTIALSSLVIEFEKMLERSLKSELSVDTMKVDYPIAYVLLDQFIDAGYPFIDEFNLLCSSFNDTTKDTIGFEMQSPWRTSSPVKSAQYIEITVDEEIHSRINSEGKSENLVVAGKVNMFSRLYDPSNVNFVYLLPSKLEDYSFHRCIDPSLHLSRKMQFIPPDGQFTLMSYTCKANITNLPVFVIPKFSFSKVSVIFDISIRLAPNYISSIKNIQISFNLPKGFHQPSCAAGTGSMKYLKGQNMLIWSLEATDQKEILSLSGSCSIDEGINKNSCEIPIFVDFKLEDTSISGFKIEEIDPINNVKCNKVIKYQTRAGRYIFDNQ
ncbi:Adaptor complexes medium subunit family protein [Trichomonas vaginalis G3]|uniref:Adaptor complexes medium subunit family protein n=1 Tax=Trichomonas vaginalis (strain ATCC PRA-98 / G3) TaxID=412133 RepID=A2E9B8_TRIV3|nr:anterograde synaptic vesicle transport [Trichomonas vaginalis G3]EAY10803.1 Adaptor complexes medium subunit family protein [Trichomonas vaginalis G3]KAI5536057.1 anterograde synaptic vesicle transport [Trichomonas vaginalis G3]|eukprot:XP_001323026.1 Adaptor complexes medium subunit family protein [Trichomonas vaginalis G3]